MTRISLILLAGLVATPSLAQHLGPTAPPKFDRPTRTTHDHQLPGGGDTFVEAFRITALPFADAGTTVGYADDYDAVCPYQDSTAPDVVYNLVLPVATSVDIDLCGSAYDTKVYVYGAGMELVACNDDFYYDDECGAYVSKLEAVPIDAGVKYFLVIDGYGDEAGDYELRVEEYVPCAVDCPDGGDLEGEPELVDGYEDSWNGGCNSNIPVFQPISGNGWDGDTVFCGVAGWYLYQGAESRDTDWFSIMMGTGGVVSVTIDAEQPTYLFELFPHDCDDVAVAQQVAGGPCEPATMVITGYGTAETIWVWVGATQFAQPPEYGDNEYPYVVWFEGLLYGGQPLATERATWGAVKSLYR